MKDLQDNPIERLYTGYRTSASAAVIAIDRLKREGMFNNTNFKLVRILIVHASSWVISRIELQLF